MWKCSTSRLVLRPSSCTCAFWQTNTVHAEYLSWKHGLSVSIITPLMCAIYKTMVDYIHTELSLLKSSHWFAVRNCQTSNVTPPLMFKKSFLFSFFLVFKYIFFPFKLTSSLFDIFSDRHQGQGRSTGLFNWPYVKFIKNVLKERKGNVLFNDALNTFEYGYIWRRTYGKGPFR